VFRFQPSFSHRRDAKANPFNLNREKVRRSLLQRRICIPPSSGFQPFPAAELARGEGRDFEEACVGSGCGA
jgi:hypothetical protein